MIAIIKDLRPSLEHIWAWLEEIPDPEIPVISIVELGIVREVSWHGDQCVVTVTPTYSGCPAIDLIQSQIHQSLREHGIANVRICTRLAPAWSTDWLSQKARNKLRIYGIAPPVGKVTKGWSDFGLHTCNVSDFDPETKITCPRCHSTDTELLSAFGSTPCKSLHRCRQCLEPFDYFKCH